MTVLFDYNFLILKEIEMDGTGVIVISAVFYIVLFLYVKAQNRNNWVCEIKLEWNLLVKDYRMHILDYGVDYYRQMDEIYTHMRMINIMYSYTSILLMFWKKDLKSCIKPVSIDLFEEIISIKKENK